MQELIKPLLASLKDMLKVEVDSRLIPTIAALTASIEASNAQNVPLPRLSGGGGATKCSICHRHCSQNSMLCHQCWRTRQSEWERWPSNPCPTCGCTVQPPYVQCRACAPTRDQQRAAEAVASGRLANNFTGVLTPVGVTRSGFSTLPTSPEVPLTPPPRSPPAQSTNEVQSSSASDSGMRHHPLREVISVSSGRNSVAPTPGTPCPAGPLPMRGEVGIGPGPPGPLVRRRRVRIGPGPPGVRDAREDPF